jgi:hypothetical protein
MLGARGGRILHSDVTTAPGMVPGGLVKEQTVKQEGHSDDEAIP